MVVSNYLSVIITEGMPKYRRRQLGLPFVLGESSIVSVRKKAYRTHRWMATVHMVPGYQLGINSSLCVLNTNTVLSASSLKPVIFPVITFDYMNSKHLGGPFS